MQTLRTIYCHKKRRDNEFLILSLTDGKIEFAFEMGKHTCLNSIDIAQKQDIEVKNVKSAVIAKRDTASVKLTWDKADGVIGYRGSRRNPKNNEIDKVQEVRGIC